MTASRSNGSSRSSGNGRGTHVNGKAKSAGDKASGGRAASAGKSQRPDLTEVLGELPKGDLDEAYRFWAGDGNGRVPREATRIRDDVLGWMGEPDRVVARLGGLGRRLAGIFDHVLDSPRYETTFDRLVGAPSLAYLSQYDLEAGLAVLQRRGMLYEGSSRDLDSHGRRAWCVPAELGDTILRARRAERRGIFDIFTLKGYLDRLYDDPGRKGKTPPGRVREMYKLYANEAAAVARIERLPEGLRDLVQKVVLEFGGILPRGLFDRMDTELPHWNGRRWRKILEESLIGTVERLDLARFGIQHADETLIVFNEVALAWLKRVAVPGDPDRPHDEASLGVDLVANVSRFLGFLLDHNVRFTVRGEIFKTTEKRILQDLIPNPGRELERSEVLAFIYGFARRVGLIESTGERTFTLTRAGREWEEHDLETKLSALLDHVLEELENAGESQHQIRMRRTFLRLVKRVEPGVWYDIMYLPFLARNHYLCSLEAELDEERTYAPMEDLQRLAWSLVGWVRKRLYLIGIVDLGYDKSGHPVAVRLTRLGARLLGLEERGDGNPGIGSIVVTPDFEVVLFPTGDDAELIHDLDRFCEREKAGHLMHFRVVESGVKRALAEGMPLERIVQTLESNARTPVPQNVMYSVRDWASQAGLLFLNEDLIVRGEDPELVSKFAADPGVRPYVRRVLDEERVSLQKGPTPSRMRSLLRDLNYLIELE